MSKMSIAQKENIDSIYDMILQDRRTGLIQISYERVFHIVYHDQNQKRPSQLDYKICKRDQNRVRMKMSKKCAVVLKILN